MDKGERLTEDRDFLLLKYNPDREPSVFFSVSFIIEAYVTGDLTYKQPGDSQNISQLERATQLVVKEMTMRAIKFGTVPPETKFNSSDLTRNPDVLTKTSRLYFPLQDGQPFKSNTGLHFTLFVVDIKKNELYLLDSLYPNSLTKKQKDFVKAGKEIIQSVYNHFGIDTDVTSWPVRLGKHFNVDKQTNGDDCGCFCVTYLDYLNDNVPLDIIKAKDMAFYRNRLGIALLKEHLPWSFKTLKEYVRSDQSSDT